MTDEEFLDLFTEWVKIASNPMSELSQKIADRFMSRFCTIEQVRLGDPVAFCIAEVDEWTRVHEQNCEYQYRYMVNQLVVDKLNEKINM